MPPDLRLTQPIGHRCLPSGPPLISLLPSGTWEKGEARRWEAGVIPTFTVSLVSAAELCPCPPLWFSGASAGV